MAASCLMIVMMVCSFCKISISKCKVDIRVLLVIWQDHCNQQPQHLLFMVKICFCFIFFKNSILPISETWISEAWISETRVSEAWISETGISEENLDKWDFG